MQICKCDIAIFENVPLSCSAPFFRSEVSHHKYDNKGGRVSRWPGSDIPMPRPHERGDLIFISSLGRDFILKDSIQSDGEFAA